MRSCGRSFSGRPVRPFPNRGESIDALVMQAISRAINTDNHHLDGVDLSIRLTVAPDANIPDDDEKAASAILRALAEVFADAAGGSATPAYLHAV